VTGSLGALGVVDVLPVAQRSVPFDADAGSDAAGDPVVVYSRCAREPANPSASPGGADFGAGPSADWQNARGCDVYELPLTGALAERKLTAASSKTQFETTPSMWRGGLVVARHADASASTKLLYLPDGAKRPRALGGGSAQTCRKFCTPPRRAGARAHTAWPCCAATRRSRRVRSARRRRAASRRSSTPLRHGSCAAATTPA